MFITQILEKRIHFLKKYNYSLFSQCGGEIDPQLQYQKKKKKNPRMGTYPQEVHNKIKSLRTQVTKEHNNQDIKKMY
jgi:hypothetical protein